MPVSSHSSTAVILAALAAGSFSAASPASSALELAPGLTHSELLCEIGGRPLELEELRADPRRGIELQALGNPRAKPDSRCRAGYGGPDLPALIAGRQPPDAIVAATNGAVFRATERTRSGEGPGYASNHLLWSKRTGLLAPLRRAGGTRLFVADSRGGRELRLSFEACARGIRGACARILPPYPPGLDNPARRPELGRARSGEELIATIRSAYPSMTLALQGNMPLSGGDVAENGEYRHYSRCPTDAEGRPRAGDWRCVRAQRTLLCARENGGISLYTTKAPAYPHDLASALRPGGSCSAGCALLYNLDGGGSTQMGYRSPQGNWVMSGSRMETSEPGCSPYRPVDHYLAFEAPAPRSRPQRR